MQTEKLINTGKVLDGGTIELFKLEGFYYVKSNVNSTIKFSECVSKFKAEFLYFDAINYGCLDF